MDLSYISILLIGYSLSIIHLSLASEINTTFYYNNDDLTTFLLNVASTYPNITKLHSIGKSVENRDLWALEITQNVKIQEPGKPNFKYIGNMHGNEVVGRQVLIYLIQYLVENYPTDERVTKLVDNVDMFIMPSMNPDGFEEAKEGDCAGLQGRNNANNQDLNRNFPNQFDPNTGQLQPETQAIIDWSERMKFVLSANIHGSTLVACYPWDTGPHKRTRYSAAPDDAVFKHLAKTYSDSHRTMHTNAAQKCHYENNFKGGIINGAKWYPVSGSMQDYSYASNNCFEIMLELSCCKYPHSSELTTEWENNKEALLAYMEHIHIGVNGRVVDEETGEGIPNVVVSVRGIDKNFTTDEFGYFWRLLTSGTYTLSFRKHGYRSYMSDPITVPYNGGKKLNVRMKFVGLTLHTTHQPEATTTAYTKHTKPGTEENTNSYALNKTTKAQSPMITSAPKRVLTTAAALHTKTMEPKIPLIHELRNWTNQQEKPDTIPTGGEEPMRKQEKPDIIPNGGEVLVRNQEKPDIIPTGEPMRKDIIMRCYPYLLSGVVLVMLVTVIIIALLCTTKEKRKPKFFFTNVGFQRLDTEKYFSAKI